MNRLTPNLIGLKTITKREVARFIRIWSQTLLPPVITMALYFFIFGSLIGQRIGTMEGFVYMEYIVPGLIMMSIITNSYANVVASFFGSKFQKNIEEMLVSPMSASVILWGFVLGGVARGVIVGLLVTVVSLAFTKLQISSLGLTFLVGTLAALLFSLAGLINGIFAKKFDDINIVPTFILTPLTYLGGVFYSTEVLSEFWQKVMYINPIFYMVNAFRFGILGSAGINIKLAFWVIGGLIVMLYGLSLFLLKRGTGIRS